MGRVRRYGDFDSGGLLRTRVDRLFRQRAKVW
jgi:hypothetical protein